MSGDVFSVLDAWPAFAAAVVAGAIPREAKPSRRFGFALVAFVLVMGVMMLWPGSPSDPTAKEWPLLLNLLVGLPIAGSVAVMFVPRQMLSLLRGVTYGVFAVGFVASLWLLRVPMTPGWHFQYITEWIPVAGIRYHVAVDGISVWLIVLTTFTTPIAAYSAFGSIRTRIKELCVSFLLLQGAMIGAFVALDLFLFYVFWELMLVPMFLMIGIWGGAEKIKAAIKFFVFTMTGSVLMLAAMLYLVWTNHELTGQWTFDYLALARVVLPGAAGSLSPATLCFWAFSIAFFIKVPMFPVHTWLPDAHVQAPTGGSVVLAAVMLKLGTYAYMRFSMVLFPAQAASYAATLAGVAILGGILYGALCAWKQSDVKRLVAYSSVAHLGFVMLGLFGATPQGIKGGVLQMVNHGLATGALFMLVGVIYDRRHTREVAEFGGLAKVMPVYAAAFIVVTMASIGVPGTNGFIGEFMIIVGTYASERLNQFGPIQAVGAAFGVILAAVYMLGVVQKMFFGPLDNPKNKHLQDITTREGLALAPLVVMIFVMGLFPSIFLSRMDDSVGMFHKHFTDVFGATGPGGELATNNAARRIPDGFLPEAFLKGAPAPPDETDGDDAKRQALNAPLPKGGAQ
jgi:NADH-quinone oxidoreductase subunit M